MTSRPKQVEVWYRGIPYLLDLVRCWQALVHRQVDGDLDSMESLAKAVGISRSTASRFFSGRATSLTVTLKILATLKLTFNEVARPITEESPNSTRHPGGRDDPQGMAGAAVVVRPGPAGRPDGTAVTLERTTA